MGEKMDEFLYIYAIGCCILFIILYWYRFKSVTFKLADSFFEMPAGHYCLKKTMFIEITYANFPFPMGEGFVCDSYIIPKEGFWQKKIRAGTPVYFVNKNDFKTKKEFCFKYYPSSGKFVVISEQDKKV